MGTSDGRVAIVTGGTRGMGVGIAEALAEQGKRLALVYRSNDAKAKETGDKLAGRTEVMILKADVSRKAEADRVAAEVLAKWGRIDILVNNAGIFDFKFLEDMDEEFMERMHRGNLLSAVFMTQAVIPAMKKGRFGRIMNASSISSTLADIGLVAYAASKAGIDMLTKISAGELAPWGITVNAFAPGIIDTDMTSAMIKERGHEQVKQIPLGRFGDNADVGAVVAFLCSDAAGYVTGEVLGIDGGMMKVQNPGRAKR